MTKAKFSPFDVADHIKTAEDAVHYLDAVLLGGDANEIAEALGVVARSKGMATIAEESGLSRETLYRTLSDAGNPSPAAPGFGGSSPRAVTGLRCSPSNLNLPMGMLYS